MVVFDSAVEGFFMTHYDFLAPGSMLLNGANAAHRSSAQLTRHGPAVQKIMVHKTIQTTMQYVHATDEGKRRAVQAVKTAGKLVPIWSQESARKTG